MRWIFVAFLLFTLGCRPAGDAPHAPPREHPDHDGATAQQPEPLTIPPSGSGEPQNPLQVEMRGLTSLMHVAMVAVANDQLALIPPAIGQVHGAIEETQAALKAGRLTLPRNADDVEGFLETDDAFHDELVVLLRAARANDLPAATKQLGVLFEGCTSCHEKYRFPPRP